MASGVWAKRISAIVPLLVAFSFIVKCGATAAADRGNLLVAQTPPRTPQEQQRLFHLPAGYTIELVASEPQIVKPINMKFDSAGRLYVTQSYEYPFPVAAGHPGRDTIRRLVDTNADGIPDKVNVFADKLCIPIGLTPIPGGLFGHSIPYLYRFLDRDGDGIAETREIAYRGFGSRDTHGMVNGMNYWLDGWIYCCHGFSNESTVKGTDGSTVTMQSGNTFRVRPDGSRIEQFSWGQVNPFGMTFDERGDMYTADCHSRPATLVLRGAYYQSFGKPHDGLGFAPDIMTHSHGSTGICAIVVSHDFPPAGGGDDLTLLLANPVTGRINFDRLESKGSTVKAIELPDFVTCDDPWFRPVDLQLAADGSLYIADFYNCIIGHYEVPLTHPLRDKTRGRIWRISRDRKGEGQRAPLDLSRASLETLVDALGNQRVQNHAVHELIDRIGKPAIEPVQKLVYSSGAPATSRAYGLWVLAGLHAFRGELAERAVNDREMLVRLHAAKVIGEEPKWEAWQRGLVRARLNDGDAFVRRAAAEALGRHPDASDLELLSALWQMTDPADTMLIHVTRIALRNVVRSDPRMERLADAHRSSPELVRQLIDVTFGIHTPESAALMFALTRQHPGFITRPAETVKFIVDSIPAGRISEVQQFASTFRGKDAETERAVLINLFRACRDRRVAASEDLKRWAAKVTERLLDSDDGGIQQGIELAVEAAVPSAAERLSAVVEGNRPPKLRGAAADALVRIDAKRGVPVVETLVGDPESPLRARCEVIESLKHANSPQSRGFLVATLKVAPAPLAASIVDTLALSREGAVDFVDAAEKGQCSPRLLSNPGVRGRLQAVGSPPLEARINRLLQGLPSADERINKLIATHAGAFRKTPHSMERGVAVFQKNCAACHQIGGKGSRVGPNLDGVGVRGVDRVLEDLLDPNRNVDVNFRATTLTLDTGEIVTGLVLRQEGAILVVVDNKGKEQRISADKVESRNLSKLSPMPANVADSMQPQEIYDLTAYLLQQRAAGETNR